MREASRGEGTKRSCLTGTLAFITEASRLANLVAAAVTLLDIALHGNLVSSVMQIAADEFYRFRGDA